MRGGNGAEEKKVKLTDRASIELIFDNKESLKQFVSAWLDGELNPGHNFSWETNHEESDDLTQKTPRYIRIEGTGNYYEY